MEIVVDRKTASLSWLKDVTAAKITIYNSDQQTPMRYFNWLRGYVNIFPSPLDVPKSCNVKVHDVQTKGNAFIRHIVEEYYNLLDTVAFSDSSPEYLYVVNRETIYKKPVVFYSDLEKKENGWEIVKQQLEQPQAPLLDSLASEPDPAPLVDSSTQLSPMSLTEELEGLTPLAEEPDPAPLVDSSTQLSPMPLAEEAGLTPLAEEAGLAPLAEEAGLAPLAEEAGLAPLAEEPVPAPLADSSPVPLAEEAGLTPLAEEPVPAPLADSSPAQESEAQLVDITQLSLAPLPEEESDFDISLLSEDPPTPTFAQQPI